VTHRIFNEIMSIKQMSEQVKGYLVDEVGKYFISKGSSFVIS
jgi:hypothetical protein